MKPLPPAEQTCENCVHSRSKGPEHCSCYPGEPPFPFQEDPWHLEVRADKIIEGLREQIASMQEIIEKAYAVDCERGDDGGVVEGEAAHILRDFLVPKIGECEELPEKLAAMREAYEHLCEGG